jgi:KaiC/GvpD/RAD55 family RecA-like ATPase
MIRAVPTGDLGLDVLLGGGWRLVERLPGRESATILLRGGPGTGKTLLSVDVALALAGALDGDVVVACVELLPSEYIAQIEAGRAELVLQWREGQQLAEPRMMMLPQATPVAAAKSPRIFCGLVADLDPSMPDLVAALESLRREVVALNGKPVAFIVDSLISGYGLGPAAPRQNVDAVMKFAAQEGVGLVLCEEAPDDAPSAWDFSADTVLALEHHREGDRQIFVKKHRYGPSAPGAHQLEIGGWKQPRVGPRPDAWFGRYRIETTLRGHGWRFLNAHGYPPLQWIDDLAPTPSEPRGYGCSFAVVSGPNLELARKLALGLVPADVKSRRDIVIELDPLGLGFHHSDGWSSSSVDVHFLPVSVGPNAAVCELVEYLGSRLFAEKDEERPRRIVIGDVATVAAFADHAMWAEAIRVIAALVAESGWGIPVIAYDSSAVSATGVGGLALLRWRAELVVEVNYSEDGIAIGHATSRPDGTFDTLHWSDAVLSGPWPKEIAHLERLPGPSRRGHFSKIRKKGHRKYQ